MHVISTWPLSHDSDVQFWTYGSVPICMSVSWLVFWEQILEYLKAWLTTFTVMINTVGEGKEDAKQIDFDNLALSH